METPSSFIFMASLLLPSLVSMVAQHHLQYDGSSGCSDACSDVSAALSVTLIQIDFILSNVKDVHASLLTSAAWLHLCSS